MPKQIPFSQHEAVLLLHSLVQVLERKSKRSDAIRKCSEDLRRMAINKGMEIDDAYRNIPGIGAQMTSMRLAYDGRTIAVPIAKLFIETVNIYRNNREKYDTMLHEAQKLASKSKENLALHNTSNIALTIDAVEFTVLQAGISGMTIEELADKVSLSVRKAQKAVASAMDIVSIGNRLVHKDSVAGWEEGANQLEAILAKLMEKNNGYVSYVQLYEYARAEMDLFLHENDMLDPRKVFDIAQYLFEKRKYHGKHYIFQMKTHISQPQDKIISKLDVIKKYAHDNQGFFRQDELQEYLQKIGVQTSSLRQQMKIYEEPIFLLYEPGVFITKESIGINKAWLKKTREAFRKLFEDSCDHVVLRDIDSCWYLLLPVLPHGKPWTLLLLQNVLMHFSTEIGARVIRCHANQTMETLGAMVVRLDSEIQTFADAVISVLLEDNIEERRFDAEELRQMLVKRGLIGGNELMWNMPKALPSDEHFVWDADGKYVTVRI